MKFANITIKGEFPSLNEFIDANRKRDGKWSAGNAMKQRDQNAILWQLPRVHFSNPVWISYRFYCRNRKRDKDNVCGYFHKVFQDALVTKRIIDNDGWKNIIGFSDEFYVDKNNPRVEIHIREGRHESDRNGSGVHT